MNGIYENVEPLELAQPLLGLIEACETLCEVECCGIDAFDFSPIHMASHLIRYYGHPRPENIDEITSQLLEMDAVADLARASGRAIIIDQLNQYFTGQALADLSTSLKNGLLRAHIIIQKVHNTEL